MCPCIWTWLSFSLSPLFIVSTHSDFTTAVVVSWLISSLSLSASISAPLSSTHTFSYLISALQSPCLALGSCASLSVVVWNWAFSGSEGSTWHSDPRRRAQWQLAFYLFSPLLYYFWSANGANVFTIMCHWHTPHNLEREELLSEGIKSWITESVDRRGDFAPGENNALGLSLSPSLPRSLHVLLPVSQQCQ